MYNFINFCNSLMITTESNKSIYYPDSLYYLSENNYDNRKISPRVPEPPMNGVFNPLSSDTKIKRLCFYSSVRGAIAALPNTSEGKEYFIHEPILIDEYADLGHNYTIYDPDPQIAPWGNAIGEYWIKTPVTLICTGKIRLTKKSRDKAAFADNNGIKMIQYWEYEAIPVSETKGSRIQDTNQVFMATKRRLTGKIINPYIPEENLYVRFGVNDNKVLRVPFSKTIEGAIMISDTSILPGQSLSIYSPDGKYKQYTPTLKQVPQSIVSNEVWIKEPVKLKYVGKIHIGKKKGFVNWNYLRKHPVNRFSSETAHNELWNWLWE